MLDHVTKIKKACVALLGALLCTGAVLLSNTVPVFASDYGETSGTLGVHLCFNTSNTVQAYNTTNDFSYDLPVYVYFTNVEVGKYYSGYELISGGVMRNNLKFTTGTGASLTPDSFIVNPDSGLNFSGYERQYPVIYFDNFYGTNTQVLLGYFHFDFRLTGYTQTNINVNTSDYDCTIGTISLVKSTSPYGIVEAVTNAIIEAYTINDVFDILNNIGINSGYLPYIFQNLQLNHNAMYSLLQSVWNTDVAILGVDRDIYTTVLSIYALLDNQYNTQESQAAGIADDINQGLDNLAHDMEVVQPSAVADLADSYISQIDTSYNSQVFNFLSNNYIILMLCLVFAFSILSYMLYGGQ